MEQENLEERVSHIFERQGFEVEIDGNRFKAQREEAEVSGTLFSSQRFEKEEVVEAAEGKVFVDEELLGVAEALDDVSVLESQDTGDIDMPSFEVIGDIAVINELEMPEDEAVDAILSHHDVKTILLKTEPLQGEFRVGKYKTLHGTETETIHRENGCRFKVDVTKSYFSERFSTERMRISDMIEDNEDILVMFAGVGPFAVQAAKSADNSSIVAVEKNPKAAALLNENVSRNGVEDYVEVFEADVRNVLPDLDQKFDRVIMPLPGSAEEYIDLLPSLMKSESTIHLYTFASKRGEKLQNWRENGLSCPLSDFSFDQLIQCGQMAPGKGRYCVEFRNG